MKEASLSVTGGGSFGTSERPNSNRAARLSWWWFPGSPRQPARNPPQTSSSSAKKPPPRPDPSLVMRLAETRAALEQARGQLEAAEQALLDAQEQNHLLSTKLEAARMAAIEQARGDAPPSLLQVFRDRGVWGEVEVRQLWTALDERGALRELLGAITVAQSADLLEWLNEHTAILGDCPQCPDVGNRAVLRVPRSRCEICAGSDIRRTGRKFVDGFLSRGFTRFTVVGGSPKYHRQLHELIKHHRIRLRTVPGGSRRSRRQARDDIRGSDLVVVWGGTQLSHSTSEQYTSQADEGQVLVVPHRGISGMLEAVTVAINAV